MKQRETKYFYKIYVPIVSLENYEVGRYCGYIETFKNETEEEFITKLKDYFLNFQYDDTKFETRWIDRWATCVDKPYKIVVDKLKIIKKMTIKDFKHWHKFKYKAKDSKISKIKDVLSEQEYKEFDEKITFLTDSVLDKKYFKCDDFYGSHYEKISKVLITPEGVVKIYGIHVKNYDGLSSISSGLISEFSNFDCLIDEFLELLEESEVISEQEFNRIYLEAKELI